MRAAVVHYWVVTVRGGERVFFELARCLPDADLYTFHHDPALLPFDLRSRGVRPSLLQRRPFAWFPHRSLLPLLPAAAWSIDVRDHDPVVVSSTGWTHGVRVGDGARLVCYMHSPPRYLYHEAAPTPAAHLARPILGPLRRWDQTKAARVTTFIANSETTRRRIGERYRRDAVVIPPPIDTSRFLAARIATRGDYVVAAGELVPYKRFDLAITACRAAGLRLVVVGDGPERHRLERLAEGAEVTFLGRVDNPTYVEIVAGAGAYVLPGVEDFGMATVEAMAAGVPVVGAAAGGTAEIVKPGTGLLVEGTEPREWGRTLESALSGHFDPAVLAARAAEYDVQVFHDRIRAELQRSTT